MAWCSVYDEVRDHPKTRALAKLLNCNRQEAIGTLVCLWLWGLNNADRNGRLLNASKEDIADGIMSRGRSADSLVDSLVNSGWLDEIGDVFILHDWDAWQEQWYKALDRRDADTARKRIDRAKKTSERQFIGQSAGQSYGQPDGQSVGTSATNRTVPNRTVPNRNLTENNTSDHSELGMSDEATKHLIETSRKLGYPLSETMQQWAEEHNV